MDTLLIYKGRQSLEGCLTDYSNSTAVRAVVKRDAYDAQSHAIAQAWSDNGWVDIQRFPVQALAVKSCSYVDRDGDWEHVMEKDLTELVRYAHDHLNHKEEN